jgi:DNA-binding NtrC family response regulator
MHGPGPLAVLVADDDAALRLLCRVNLELDGYRVFEARNEAELDEILGSEAVGVILLDVHLGADDGLAIAARLRDERPGLPVALFTGSVDRRDSWRDVADGFLSKPFRLEELGETVRRLAADR